MDSFTTLITFTFTQDAYLAKAFLESEGLQTFLKDELTVQFHPFYSNAIGGVKLQVKKSEYENGLDILKRGGYINSESTEEIKIEIIPLDNRINKNICPFCQSDNIGKRKEQNILNGIVHAFLGVIAPIFKKSYQCFDCNKVWKFVKQ